jgi:Uncharacterized MobA-related protein
MIKKTGIIILAAGNSSRLGAPKQLLAFEGKSLLRRITDEASLNPDHQVIVVLGASHETIHDELTGAKVEMVINADWEDGMSGSIKTGLESLLQATPDLEQCIITVCDQPFINANVFHELKVLAKETEKGIITTGFAGTWGFPFCSRNGISLNCVPSTVRRGRKKSSKNTWRIWQCSLLRRPGLTSIPKKTIIA